MKIFFMALFVCPSVFAAPETLDIYLKNDHHWSLPTKIMIPPHSEGVLVRFYNLDESAPHLVHGQGAIPHGNEALPPALDGQPQGVYKVHFKGSKPNTSGSFYCHNHQDSEDAHEIIFNAQ